MPDNVNLRSSYTYDHSKQFGLRAVITYSNDSKDYYYVPFNADVSGWQFASLTIIPATAKTVSTIAVSCVYETNANIAYFDNISLVLETAQSTTYDDNGNPTSASTTGLNKQTVTYDSNGNVKTVVQKTGSESANKITTTYTYDSTFIHRMVSSSNGVTTQTLTHDGVGNVLTSTLSGKSGRKIASSTAYSADGNRTASVTDSAGNTTSYTYGSTFYEMLGQASKITDAKGTQTTYTLDTFGRVTNMSLASLAQLGYTYSNGMLSALTRTAGSSQQTYKFTYDSFGNTNGITIGDSVTLASYLYGTKNGLLQTQTYGNGDSVSFTYDNLGRVKTTTYSDGRVLTYRYTGDGQLYSVQDSKTGLTYQYSYDSQGRLMASSVKNSAGNVLTTRQTYDANNQMTAQSWQMGSTNYSEVYTYGLTTGLLATHTPAVGSTRTYNYDVLQRLSSVTGGVYGKTYTYRDTSTTNTTTQVAGLTYDLPTDITYGYTYDVLGNIATYTQGGTTYTYTYDAQNQLLKQVGGGKTYTYTYDAAGNILTSSDGTTSHSYTYGNSVWKDLLTAVDGHAITYETGSGNPTSYYNGTSWTFGWAEGRRLISASGGGKSISYTYDSEGLRLSKTVGSTKHNYYYAGGKLMRETWGSNTLDFFYDAQGTPYAVKYNGTLYYYITNLHGDVLHITNSSGTTVVSYTYDPYGKPLTTTGSLASTLGADNPLRYRSYYYDIDSGLYYLQSRYYDPELCRFLNADSYASTGQGILGCNMFAYCGNNAVNSRDTTGEVFECLNGRGFNQARTMQAPYGGGYSYITDQKSRGTGEKRFGLVTVAHGGCGPVATYNALFSMGDYTSFDEVLAYYNQNVTNLNIGGFAGTPVSLVAQYFTDHGYTVYLTDDPYEFDIYSQVADSCIVCYMFPSSYSLLGITIEAFGEHFVEYSKTSSGYIGRNTGTNGLYEFTVPSDFAYRGSNYYAIGIFIFEQ